MATETVTLAFLGRQTDRILEPGLGAVRDDMAVMMGILRRLEKRVRRRRIQPESDESRN